MLTLRESMAPITRSVGVFDAGVDHVGRGAAVADCNQLLCKELRHPGDLATAGSPRGDLRKVDFLTEKVFTTPLITLD